MYTHCTGDIKECANHSGIILINIPTRKCINKDIRKVVYRKIRNNLGKLRICVQKRKRYSGFNIIIRTTRRNTLGRG